MLLFQSYTVAGIGQSFSKKPPVISLFPNAKMNLFVSTNMHLNNSICLPCEGQLRACRPGRKDLRAHA